jgi:hypothetical protein
MLRTVLLLACSTFLITGPALAAAAETHSGTVSAIDRGRHGLTLEEMGPWKGPGTGMVKRSITLAPDTKLELVRRTTGTTPDGWAGGYVESALAPTQLRVGDFAAVKVVHHGRRAVAVSVEVIRPSGR